MSKELEPGPINDHGHRRAHREVSERVEERARWRGISEAAKTNQIENGTSAWKFGKSAQKGRCAITHGTTARGMKTLSFRNVEYRVPAPALPAPDAGLNHGGCAGAVCGIVRVLLAG